jgi:GGDEF domain-containing protein
MFGEDVSDLLDAAEPALREVLREEDLSGRLTHDMLVVGLTGLSPDTVRSLSYRLKGDLQLRSTHIRQSVWETGYASMPEDGATPEELLAIAMRNARNARLPV